MTRADIITFSGLVDWHHEQLHHALSELLFAEQNEATSPEFQKEIESFEARGISMKGTYPHSSAELTGRHWELIMQGDYEHVSGPSLRDYCTEVIMDNEDYSVTEKETIWNEFAFLAENGGLDAVGQVIEHFRLIGKTPVELADEMVRITFTTE